MQAKIKVDDEISFLGTTRIDEIAAEWNSIVSELSVFFSPDFLRAVENAPPNGLENRYLLVYRKDSLIGVVNCQLKSFNASESIKFKDQAGFISKSINASKNLATSLINFEGLVCGSVLLTGMYAYHFNDEGSHKDHFLLAEKIVEAYRKNLNRNGKNIKVVFLKDFYAEKQMEKHSILKSETRYKEFSVQPNMILHLKKEWKSYEDYLAAFQSKYRVRAKRARKKMEGISCEELDYAGIIKHNSEIFKLYHNIVDNINFNLFFLDENYFAELKKNLKNKFKMFAYFKGDKMVAFYTCIDNINEMNAHFIGYDPYENREHQLYLNSLYDMVGLSLKYNFETINFSRTAMEIKSSMGAEPYDMYCYLTHKNNIINGIVARIVGALNPTEEWVQRKPFK